jgi:hypothetical protein
MDCCICIAQGRKPRKACRGGPSSRHRGPPICRKCWNECKQRAAQTKEPLQLPLTPEEMLIARQAELILKNPQRAQFEGLASIAGPAPGTTLH